MRQRLSHTLGEWKQRRGGSVWLWGVCHWGRESLGHTGFGMHSLGCDLNSSCGGYQDLQLGPRWGGRDKEHSTPVSHGPKERQAALLSQVQQVFTCYLLTSGPRS